MARLGAFAAGITAVICLLTAGRADVQDFYGNWETAGSQTTGVAHVQISPAGGNHVNIRVYGRCHPIECDWGLAEGRSYSDDPHSRDVNILAADFNTGFAHKELIFRKAGGDVLLEVLTDFIDGSGRHDFDVTDRLRHSAWASPIGQNWERTASTGWGGGARLTPLPKLEESCIGFDPAEARVALAGSVFRVVANGQTLAQSGERDASRALGVIRHYRFDKKCRAGATVYWKHGGEIPGGRAADCIAFNPTTVHAALVGHAWKIVDGPLWIADFAANKEDAEAALSLIRFYGLSRECFVPRQNPAMIYWLTP
jgi:hypothetical protein